MKKNSPEKQQTLSQWLMASESQAVRDVVAKSGSVVSLAQRSLRGLITSDQLHVTEARQLHDRARSVAVAVARQFRERELKGGRRAFESRHGLHALTAGPRYDFLFNPDFDAMAQSNAIEARISPVAYLTQLYRKALELEAGSESDFKLRLSKRRPDLAQKTLDTAVMNSPCRTLSIVNEVLEHAIGQYLETFFKESDEGDSAVDRALVQCRYPWRMPYEHWQEQINTILSFAESALTLGDVARQMDNDYPYFYRKGAHSSISDVAMQQSIGLGPNRRAVLIEAPYFPVSDDASILPVTNDASVVRRGNPHTLLTKSETLLEEQARFFKRNFGVETLQELQRTEVFCLQTDTPRHDLDTLFAIQTHAPFISPNVQTNSRTNDASVFGATFINSGPQPPIGLESAGAIEEMEEDEAKPAHILRDLTADRADRVNRMIRLSRWMGVSYSEADQLVMATITAEQGDPARPWMTTNTLRALGVFRDLRARYGVKAEDFAAWLHQISPYGQGDTPSQFDRIFNIQSLFAEPFVLDGTPFDIQPADTDERGKQTVQQISTALGLNQETFQYMGRLIVTSAEETQLTRSLEVVSSFYRITSLARYLKLHPIVLTALLETLDHGGESLVRQVMGKPVNISYQVYGYADLLSTLVAVVSCIEWCRDNDIDVVWLIQHIQSPVTPTVATEAENKLIREIKSRLEPVRVTQTVLLESGIPETIYIPDPRPGEYPPIEKTPNWFDLLQDLVDVDGIIRDGVSASDEDYAFSARNIIDDMLDQLYTVETNSTFAQRQPAAEETVLARPGDVTVEVEKRQLAETLLAIVLRARAAQYAVVQESGAGYLKLSAELVLPLIAWAGQSAYDLLAWSMRAVDEPGNAMLAAARRMSTPLDQDEEEEASSYDKMLIKMVDLSRLARIVQQFQLDAAMLQAHTQMWGQDWFGFEAGAVTLQNIYYLSLYARLIKNARQPPEKLLHYLRLVNDPELFASDAMDGPSADHLRLVRDGAAGKLAELLGWSAREILQIALTINPYGIVFNLVEFDKLLRCYVLCQSTGLNARALLDLGQLDFHSPDEVYRKAAQNALSCLTVATVATQKAEQGPVAEVGQSVTSTCEVSPEKLIANYDDSKNVATLTLTIRDLTNQPLRGIVVRWSVDDAGSLRQTQTVTNEDGVTTVMLYPGIIMGVARVRARIGLDQVLDMPVVLIDCDEDSLDIVSYTGRPPSPPPLAGEKTKVDLYVRLKDRPYDNAGVDRLVRWETNAGRLLQTNVHTDLEGYARVQLVNKFAEPCQVKAYYNGVTVDLPPIRFEDRPYIDDRYRLRLTTSNVAGEDITVTCRLLGLSGEPVDGETICWTVDDAEPQASTTQDGGIAQFTFRPTEHGRVKVKAQYKPSGCEAPQTLDTFEQDIDVLSDPTLIRVTESTLTTIANPEQPLLLRVRVDSAQPSGDKGDKKPIARYPVTWRISGGEKVLTAESTDELGYSTFAMPRATEGNYEVVASLSDEQKITLQIRVIPVPQWDITLNGQPVSTASTLTFRHGENEKYCLHIKPAAGQAWLKNERVALTWDGPNVIGLGLSANPSFLQILPIETEEGLEWTIICKGRESAQFALGVRLTALDHVTWLRVNLLESASGPAIKNKLRK
ncbi:Tc toxin subunit A [Mycoavidus sp. SF9855]|uniref:Tc toxin subunit A n=1 Tax=Mycoavidus sp. SF9855 TaxID=2968475 RepID=UPI00211B87CB|nr:Tc toxin subunit A [Mycoavidus sp. SF9855]UUM22272.1 Tc toxin subunit A [Mycoavidus sp. SF9855]